MIIQRGGVKQNGSDKRRRNPAPRHPIPTESLDYITTDAQFSKSEEQKIFAYILIQHVCSLQHSRVIPSGSKLPALLREPPPRHLCGPLRVVAIRRSAPGSLQDTERVSRISSMISSTISPILILECTVTCRHM